MKFIQENIFLIGIAFLSGAMLVWPMVRRGAGGPAVSTLQATLMINQQDAIVVDVREPAEFGAGHVINARNIPVAELDAKAGDVAKNKEKPVIVICATGNRSSAAVATLKKHGYANVHNLAGGLAAWQQAGLPTTK